MTGRGDFCSAQVMRDKGPSGKQLSPKSTDYWQNFTLCRQREGGREKREGKKGGDGILPRDLTGEAALSGNTDELATAIPSIPHPCSTILAKETPCAMSKIQPGNLCHKVVTVSASKGTFKVDLQYSSKGEAGWTQVGNQADPKPAQVFIF